LPTVESEKGRFVTSKFDDLSKALADGVSRRQALRLIAGGLGGTVLASVGVGRAKAAVSPCSAFCATFHGAAHAECMQTCKECGSDVTRLCATQFPVQSVTCCPGPGPVSCCGGPNGSVTCCPSHSNCCFGFPGNSVTCCPAATPLCCTAPNGTSACCAGNQECCADPSGNAVCCDRGTCCFGAGCCSSGEVCCGPAGCCSSGQVCCFGPTGPSCCTPGSAGCCQ
jgi:hypothetical protein